MDAWYSRGDYDVAAVISAQDYQVTYDNGTVVTKPTEDLWVEAYNVTWTGAMREQQIIPRTSWYVLFPPEPVNKTSGTGNLVTLYYDPSCLQFYMARNYLAIPIIAGGAIPLLVVALALHQGLVKPEKMGGTGGADEHGEPAKSEGVKGTGGEAGGRAAAGGGEAGREG